LEGFEDAQVIRNGNICSYCGTVYPMSETLSLHVCIGSWFTWNALQCYECETAFNSTLHALS